MNYEKKYKEILGQIKKAYLYAQTDSTKAVLEEIFPELAESNDEKIRKVLIKLFSMGAKYNQHTDGIADKDIIAWLEKQGHEPEWCHHKVDLSNCSEEYRKAYYDGWNNCNMQHSQCESEKSDVLKCLINGMKFYYEDNEEATWGTQKFSMKVKDILSWLEKQGQVKESAISQHENRTCEENGNSLTSEDAIEREVKEDAGGYPYIDATELYNYENDKPLAKAGDRVKVVFIKDK